MLWNCGFIRIVPIVEYCIRKHINYRVVYDNYVPGEKKKHGSYCPAYEFIIRLIGFHAYFQIREDMNEKRTEEG